MESKGRIFHDGSRRWYQYGKLHREDGPALISRNGVKYWYRLGEFHREDGPAIVFPDGQTEYYAFGIQYNSLKELNIGIILNK